MARQISVGRRRNLGWKNLLQGAGPSARHSVTDLSWHMGMRAVSISVPAGPQVLADHTPTARVVPDHPFVSGHVVARLALASTTPCCADPPRRSRRVAGSGGKRS